MKKVLGCIRKAVEEYGMIKEGDVVSVGLSGGKDSIVLLHALKLYQNFSPVKYQLKAITVANGFEGFDLSSVSDWCSQNNIPYTIKHTEIGKIIFDIRKEKNPCALCAKMRRGILHDTMKETNSNVLALGHHSDDAIETLFMSMLYAGQMKTFAPITHLSRKDLWVIRPMIYATESEVIGAQRKNNLPIVENPCPADKTTTREDMKNLTRKFYKEIPNARANIMSAMKHKDQFSLLFKEDMEKR